MNDREKLIKLMVYAKNLSSIEREADFLLANGVTFATDTNVGSKWISVEDDKPKRRGHYFIAYKFGDSDMQFYGEAFWHDDLETNGYVTGPHFSNEGMEGMKVTHWMEIPKLPEPPKAQEKTDGTDHV